MAILSYDQRLTFGLTFDPRLVPDGWCLATCLAESFAELRGAAERLEPQAFTKAAALASEPTATAGR